MAQTIHTLDELRSLVGADSIGEREGRSVVSPQTTEEVAAVTRHANNNKLTIEIVGAGTKRGWGNPVEADILLDTTRLVGVRQHSWQDLTATVAAGTTWATMQQVLAAHNQMVALDPLWPETATVSGIIATNDSGALRLKYGSLRDLIIGMTIVLADGTIAKSGGRVVKNVAGYDLHKLMTGAFGTLGVITEVTFRLHPLPEKRRGWSLCSKRSETLGTVLMQVLTSQLSTQAMQLRTRMDGFALDLELTGLSEVMASQIEILNKLARGVGINGDAISAAARAFDARQRLIDTPEGVVCKLTMLPSAIAGLTAEVVRLGGESVTQATGIMFAHFSDEAATEALPSLRASIEAVGDGSITVLRAPVSLASPSRDSENVTALMREIKRQFDPNGTLNPGRMGGGI